MDRQKYKYSELCDEINNMWKEKSKINNMWIAKSTKKVIYLTKLTTWEQTNVQRK